MNEQRSQPSYSEWNELLLSYFLGRTPTRTRVTRVAASPEELAAASGVNSKHSDEITEAFIATIRSELPLGKSFCGYCTKTGWTPQQSNHPHFFGMLWFTCLVAAGYGDEHGSFDERFHTLLEKRTPYGCVDDLWEDLAEWTTRHPDFASLELPPADEYRTVIGRSYYLAFPNRRDRKSLASVLENGCMVGFEPPILPVIRAIEKARGRFSADFRSALDNFLESFLRKGHDPRGSAFWRAIRMEALGDVSSDDQAVVDKQRLTLIANWDEDETLSLKVGCSESYSAADWQTEILHVPVGHSTRFLVDASGNPDTAVIEVLSRRSKSSRGLESLVNQGVLVFQEDLAGDYCLVSGEAIDGADIALVRDDRLETFVETFGGTSEKSRYDSWNEVESCECRQLSELPPGLDGAIQFLHTTSAPPPRLVGGIPLSGGYLWLPGFLPIIRSPTAREVVCQYGDWKAECKRHKDGDWLLPHGLRVTPPAEIKISARFGVDFGGIEISRTGTKTCRFVNREQGSAYKCVSAGLYWREGFGFEQASHTGNQPVPLQITTLEIRESGDLIATDASLRYLGPSLGQISTSREPVHQWLATGPRNSPFCLVFLGDLDSPILPDNRCSSRKADCRAWSQSFTSNSTCAASFKDGRYSDVQEEPRLREILKVYQKRARRQLDIGDQVVFEPDPPIPTVDFGVHKPAHFNRTEVIAEAVAAIGLSRSGFPLRELNRYFDELTGGEDFLLRQHVVRAWEEAGLIDLLRRQDRSQTMVTPRPPRIVMVRKGPCVDATLVGLVPQDLSDGITAFCGRARIHWTQPTTPFQPMTMRLLNTDPTTIAAMSETLGLDPPEWLLWDDTTTDPAHLRIRDDIKGMAHGAPPEEYRPDGWWDWELMVFRRYPYSENSELVEVERRWHPRRCSAYVVLLAGEPMVWTFIRNWALIRAAELRDEEPLFVVNDGIVISKGESPINLPLRLGRLCNILGLGPSGPEIGNSGQVISYRYPFGRKTWDSLEGALPASWFSNATKGNECKIR